MTGGNIKMLAKPMFFDSSSEARLAAKQALLDSRVVCSVNDVLTRVDPDEGRWFGIIILDTDALPTLLSARRQLPGFRVIGEVFPETRKRAEAPTGERPRHLTS
jgi:hypothetical protein